LIANIARFGEHVGPGLIAAIDQFSALPTVRVRIPTVKLALVNASVQLDAIAAYDPMGFKTRKGLWVSNDFQSRVGSKAKPVKKLSAITLTSGDLLRYADDKEIKADPVMPANHVFESESEFVAYLDQMIQMQLNGEKGDLLNNGYWNIFYVADCVVLVRWDSHSREWNVDTWNLDEAYWYAGYRVFGCN